MEKVAQQPLDLATALQISRELHIAIRSTPRSIALWSAGLRVPGAVRRSLHAHKAEVRELLARSDIIVCPTGPTGEHRKYWRYDGHGNFVCDACHKLRPWFCNTATRRKQRHAS